MSKRLFAIENEFSQMKSDLKSSHEEIINETNNLLDIIRKTTSQSGPLYAQNTSSNIHATVASIEEEIISRLENVFKATEETIKYFEESVTNIDENCN